MIDWFYALTAFTVALSGYPIPTAFALYVTYFLQKVVPWAGKALFDLMQCEVDERLSIILAFLAKLHLFVFRRPPHHPPCDLNLTLRSFLFLHFSESFLCSASG